MNSQIDAGDFVILESHDFFLYFLVIFSCEFLYVTFFISRKMYEKISDLPLGRVDK